MPYASPPRPAWPSDAPFYRPSLPVTPFQESARDSRSHSINLALLQMLKIACAVFLLRMGFHLVPKGLFALLKVSEKQLHFKSDNQLVKVIENRVRQFKKFMETRDKEHGSSLYKSLMAIIDGLMMLYVGGEVDRYFAKKNDNFKPRQSKDPEKMVDKVILVLIATERMENLMHHLFHWLDKHPSAGRQFVYGELAALSAVVLDTGVKIASDQYKLKKNSRNAPQAKPVGQAFIQSNPWVG